MFNRRDFLSHPTSMQSLVSSSATTAATAVTTADGAGVSNPGLLMQEATTPSGSPIRQHMDCHHNRRHRHRHHQDRSPSCQRTAGWSGGCTKRVGCVRSALLAAFVLILLGVIVTSSYAIDRRFSQIPQLLYAGLGLCSIGLIVIVVSVSLLVSRQLRKHRHRQDCDDQRQHRQHFLDAAASSGSGHRSRRGTSDAGQVPIWYIGCHRDTATAYYPPVPPSYWDAGALPPAQNCLPKPPPPPPPSRALPPPPPPQPPSYQEALRCLGGSCDQMSVLKWTVQPSQQHQQHHHFQALQLQQRAQNFLAHQAQRGSGVRRCESSSFIGEPILV